MNNSAASIRTKDDILIERQFVSGYSEFALRMNFYAIIALLEKARSVSDPTECKIICLSGLQLLYSSYEDFAVLLHAFKNRIGGKKLHLTIGVEDQPREGTSSLPRIFKHFKSVRQMLDNFGFTSITYEKLSAYLSITKDQLEEYYRDFAESMKVIGCYQVTFNDYKNKLKHGKPVVESILDIEYPDYVVFLRWIEEDGKQILRCDLLPSSLEQLEVATVQIAKIYIISLQFLWLFMLHYYPADADKYLHETKAKCKEDTVARVRALGLKSKGLTEIP